MNGYYHGLHTRGADTVGLFALRHEKWHVRGFFDPKASEKKNECDDNNTKAKIKEP